MGKQLEELEKTFIEEYESAKILIKLNKNKSGLILLSKALFALTDYIIFKQFKKLPKNHSERFRMLEQKESIIYAFIDDVWSRYTDSYSKPAFSDSISLLENAIKEVSKHAAVSKKIKEIVEK